MQARSINVFVLNRACNYSPVVICEMVEGSRWGGQLNVGPGTMSGTRTKPTQYCVQNTVACIRDSETFVSLPVDLIYISQSGIYKFPPNVNK